ncbi:hypothetical protein M5D96_002886 [Drosophila gunungcola]|uniref:Uncharacterized protein n=1 Tax=Drosophila gunungcola TaxID=103775 RepID=A0A9P9Z1N0_9MUSC|nr:hypothetical protein M5D96_002886 [Drosophila gunungcola]
MQMSALSSRCKILARSADADTRNSTPLILTTRYFDTRHTHPQTEFQTPVQTNLDAIVARQ